jgi:hypothetical protein
MTSVCVTLNYALVDIVEMEFAPVLFPCVHTIMEKENFYMTANVQRKLAKKVNTVITVNVLKSKK